MVDWPEELVRDIARRRCALVIGSGVSRQSRGTGNAVPPTWNSFLEQSNADILGGPLDHVTKAISDGDLLHACEWLQRKYDSSWTKRLRDAFSAPKYAPSLSHEYICKLDSRIVLILNFDDILERSAKKIYDGTSIEKNYYDDDIYEFLRGTGRYYIKVHGNLNTPNQLIFTQRQYSEARIKYANFYNAFDGALMTHTFLFLGAGTRDPDINLILENQNFSYNASHPHYYLAARGSIHDDLKKSLRDNRNLKVIEYERIDDNHSGFEEALKDLLSLVEPQRYDISERLDW
ncbi:MAG: SIR2 family NAD-dependent protein deacylase [Beijerinckiaceae bacterium]